LVTQKKKNKILKKNRNIRVTFFPFAYKHQNLLFKTTKKTKMKKFLAIALIAVSFTACNEGEKKAEETPAATTDSAAAATAPAAPAADTTAKVADSAAATTPAPAAADTTKK
jgi:hypothetical protein